MFIIKFILTQFSNGKWGFATKAPAKAFKSIAFSGRLSTFNTKLGRAVSKSSSPIAGVEGYIFLGDEFQNEKALATLQKNFGADGCYIECTVENGEFVQVPDSEPMTLADVKQHGVAISAPASAPVPEEPAKEQPSVQPTAS